MQRAGGKIFPNLRTLPDFSLDVLDSVSCKLHDLRKRVTEIVKKSRAGHDADDAESHELKEIFTTSMDNDLNVKSAVDRIDKFLSRGRIARLDPAKALAVVGCLHQIDSVLNVIF
jgi:cysteinyl-tRNA synthetase